jgi:dynein heavy chain
MTVPDFALIAEIMLKAEGFDDARPLAVKMTRLYKLASEQLAQAAQYDWGLRAVSGWRSACFATSLARYRH